MEQKQTETRQNGDQHGKKRQSRAKQSQTSETNQLKGQVGEQ
jgi:hypothetical protein